MTLYEAVKNTVTTLQAAERYGLKVGRGGMCKCPFHNDRNPSMKLDMRFLEGYSAGKAKGNILEFSVGLAKSLGLESVAEGVETREMVDELKRLNCEMGQGYYFSRPIPIHEFEQKFDKNQKQVVNA